MNEIILSIKLIKVSSSSSLRVGSMAGEEGKEGGRERETENFRES